MRRFICPDCGKPITGWCRKCNPISAQKERDQMPDMAIEQLLEKGELHDWPAVRLKRGQLLNAGEENWRKYLTKPQPIQLEMLRSALWRGWSEGIGCVGMIRR